MHWLHLQQVFSWKAGRELLPSHTRLPYLASCSALQRAEIAPRVLPKVCEQSNGSAVRSCWYDPFGAKSPQAKHSPQRVSLHSTVGKGWSKPLGVSLATAALSSSSFSFCPLEPPFCLVCYLYLNPCFYHLNLSFYLFIVLSPAPAMLVWKKKQARKSGMSSLTWALQQLSRCGSTETFPRISQLLVPGNHPSEMCLSCWELMLCAGNQGICEGVQADL